MNVKLFEPQPVPAWASYSEGVAHLNGTRLYYRDTGGNGQAIVLIHPATGSALTWPYQHAALVRAGYRVITYSRRGHFGSAPADIDDGGIPSHDLAALVDHLGIDKFLILACAAGCSVALDFAIGHPERVGAMVLSAGAYSNIDVEDYVRASAELRPEGFDDMPASFRELGPSYRAANVLGTRDWAALEELAVTGNRKGARSAHRITWNIIENMQTQTLFVAGGADLWSPPPLMHQVAKRVPDAQFVTISEVGHSAHWEQPHHFNRIVIDFFSQVLRDARA